MSEEDAIGIGKRWFAVGAMDRSELRIAWREAFGSATPNHMSMTFMRKALIWQAQWKAFGGLPPDVKRTLRAAAGGKAASSKKAVVRGAPLRPGTQLVREWNGKQYRVEVVEGGFRMNGERFSSLSAIALRITGTHWSGPRFFGLNDKRRGASAAGSRQASGSGDGLAAAS